MSEFTSFLQGIATAVAAAAAWRVVRLYLNRWRREEARKVLADHGLTPRRYVATAGVEDQELRWALIEYAMHGFILLDSAGNVFGAIAPQLARGRHQALVVSSAAPLLPDPLQRETEPAMLAELHRA